MNKVLTSKIALSLLIASSSFAVMQTHQSEASAVAAAYILQKTTVDKVKAGTFTYKGIKLFQSEKSMLNKLGKANKVITSETRKTYYYDGFNVMTIKAGVYPKTKPLESIAPANPYYGKGRYVYRITVNKPYKAATYNKVKAAYKGLWSKDPKKIYALMGSGKQEVKFNIPGWDKTPSTAYVKGYTIQPNHLTPTQDRPLTPPVAKLAESEKPFLLQPEMMTILKSGNLNYKGVHLDEEQSRIEAKLGQGKLKETVNGVKYVDYGDITVGYYQAGEGSFMSPRQGFEDGKYYSLTITFNDAVTKPVGGDQVINTYSDVFYFYNVGMVKSGLYQLFIQYDKPMNRPDINKVVKYGFARHDRYSSSDYIPYKGE